MKYFFAFFMSASFAVAQTPQVPHKMQFAGITLTLRDDARREIQKDVDALTQSNRHFMLKVERARTYFPVIEKIFEEERVPDDFKFLVLQESSLIADAVSVSNAVGYWQFKDFTAAEMGLRVDKQVDERMNIVSSSRAAAQYIKKNNYYFNNWLYALQAYQMGAGGVLKSVKDTQAGARHVEITSATYWYVKKFLAHKIAFENAVEEPGTVQLVLFQTSRKNDLSALAKEMSIDEAQLTEYNKWARSGVVPDDKSYAVAIPVAGAQNTQRVVASANRVQHSEKTKADASRVVSSRSDIRFFNGLPAIQALDGETPVLLAKRAGVDISLFLKYNDISITDRVKAGEFYYLKRKHKRGSVMTHRLDAIESAWSVSQKYGVRLDKIKKYNSSLKAGDVVWLVPKGKKPKAVDAEPFLILDDQSSFSWAISGTPALPAPISATPSVQNTQPASAANQPSQNNTVMSARAHTVVAGDTWYSIARTYQKDLMTLAAINQLDIKNPLKPGQVIQLTDNQTITSNPTIYHEVKASETLHSIARSYQVTIKQLMDWNQKTDFTVTVGERLKILK